MVSNWKRFLRILALIAALLLAADVTFGQTGSPLRSLTLGVNCGYVPAVSNSVGVGVAFDGASLWYSCYASQSSNDPNQFDLFKADPTTGAVLANYDIAGGLGAIAYDAGRNVIWAGEGGGNTANIGVVIQIPLDNTKDVFGPYQVAFPVPEAYAAPSSPQDTVDGLAIDSTTDTLYIHYQFATSIQKYNASTGAFLGSIAEAPGIASGVPLMTNPPINSCVASGLAIGGSALFQASDYCDYLWAVDSGTQAVESGSSFSVFSAVGATANVKGLTCDPITFPGAGDAIWVKDAYTPEAYAFQIPPGSCGFGGQPQGLPSAALSPAFLSFPTLAVGLTSSAQPTTLTNSGTGALSISGISITGTNSGDFILTNNCPAYLGYTAPGNACTILVAFKPTASGTRTATLTVADDDLASPQTAALSGSGTTLPTLTPNALPFGIVAIGTTSAPQPLTVLNPGSTTLNIKSIAVTGQNRTQYAQTNNCGGKLAAGSSCTVNVTFKPTAGGSLAATLAVTDNAANSPQTASLSGSGLSYAVTLSATSLNFGRVPIGTTTAAQSVKVTNTGTATIAFSSIGVSGPNAADFAQTNNCPSSLAPGASCLFFVTFKPSIKGTEAATLSITDNATGSPQKIALKGSGT